MHGDVTFDLNVCEQLSVTQPYSVYIKCLERNLQREGHRVTTKTKRHTSVWPGMSGFFKFNGKRCRDCGFESRRGHGCFTVVSVVCYLVEVSVTS